MKKNIYSPDEFMSGLYTTFKPEPYKNTATEEDAVTVSKDATMQAMNIRWGKGMYWVPMEISTPELKEITAEIVPLIDSTVLYWDAGMTK